MATSSCLRFGMNLGPPDSVRISDELVISGQQVVLNDSPGFDDINLSDIGILRQLVGVIYIRSAFNEQSGGISPRNFKMFHQLCRNPTLQNIVLVRGGEPNPDAPE